MLNWNADLEREDVLLQLQEAIKHENQQVKIYVEELPSFLDTRVTLQVFKKQLESYPKEIEFVTKNLAVLRLLKDAGFRTTLPNFGGQNVSSSYEDPVEVVQVEKNVLPSVASFNFVEEEEVIFEPLTVEIKKINLEPIINVPLIDIEAGAIEARLAAAREQDMLDIQLIEALEDGEEEQKSFLVVKDVSIKNSKKREEKVIIKKIDFNAYQDYNLKLDMSNNVENGDFSKMANILDDVVEDDLDSMLSNLDRIKLNIHDHPAPLFFRKPLRSLVATGFCCFVVFGFTGYLNYVPSYAYRINVKNNAQLKQELININPSLIKEKLINLSIYSEQQIPKQKKEFFDRAKGKIVLFSSGSNSCNLTNGGFLVNSNNKFYRVLPNLIYGPNVIIKPYSQSNPTLTFEIEALEKGGSLNIEKDTVLNLATIRRENLSKNCFAKAVTGVYDFTVTENNTVTQEVVSSLQDYSTKAIDQKVKEEIEDLGKKNIYTKPEWIEKENSQNLFNSEVGQVKDLVTLNRVETKKVKYLPLDAIAKQIEANIVGDTREVRNIKINSLVMEGTQYKSEVSYDLLEKTNINEKKVKEIISSSQDLVNIQELIKKEFPAVEKVQKMNDGLNIPVFKKITVDIVDLY